MWKKKKQKPVDEEENEEEQYDEEQDEPDEEEPDDLPVPPKSRRIGMPAAKPVRNEISKQEIVDMIEGNIARVMQLLQYLRQV